MRCLREDGFDQPRKDKTPKEQLEGEEAANHEASNIGTNNKTALAIFA